MHRRILLLPLLLLVGALFAFTGQAQPDTTAACPALVETALRDVGQNCDGLGRNSACYGFNRVTALFAREPVEGEFSQPADRAALVDLQTLQTAPLDPAIPEWGVALMNAQANVPNTIPGQGVVFVLLGAVTVSNGVTPDQAVVLPEQPVTVTVTTEARIRSAPSTNANIIGGAFVNTTFDADARTADSTWVRIVYENSPAWISTQVVRGDGISTLPVITTDSYTPMQAFYFATGIGQPVCSEAPPSTLVVQGPQGVTVDLTPNGVDIRIGSTVAFMTENNRTQMIVVDGQAIVNDTVVVPVGHSVDAPMNANGEINGLWANWRLLTPEEFASLLPLGNIPSNLLNYPIVPPTAGQARAAASALIPRGGPAPSPVAESTDEPGGPGPVSTEEAPAPVTGECGGFRPTSPTDGAAYGFQTFYWDPAPGATGYQVIVTNLDNGQSTGASTAATNITLDLSTLGEGFTISWYVNALSGSTVLCSSPAVTTARSVPTPTAMPYECGNQICESEYEDSHSCPADCGAATPEPSF